MILIKNGRLIDPLSKRDEIVDIAIENEKIKEIGKNLSEKGPASADRPESRGGYGY